MRVGYLEQYTEFLTHLPVTASDKTLMALKGHLLVEQALRTYISKRVPHPSRLKDKQIPFSTLIDFASSLEDDKRLEWMWEALRILNSVRNMLAHNLSPVKIEEKEAKFISFVRKNDGEFSVERNNVKLDYGQFPLAVFQLYDQLISSAPRPVSVKGASNNRIAEAIDNAFKTIGNNSLRKGPTPRKKWT